jgi:hypothetical protein
MSQAGRAYGRDNYHLKPFHEKALIASRNANRARWIEKVPYDGKYPSRPWYVLWLMYNSTEMFELPDVWRKYMDTQGWKKIEAIGFGTGAFIAWPTKPTLRVRLEVI